MVPLAGCFVSLLQRRGWLLDMAHMGLAELASISGLGNLVFARFRNVVSHRGIVVAVMLGEAGIVAAVVALGLAGELGGQVLVEQTCGVRLILLHLILAVSDAHGIRLHDHELLGHLLHVQNWHELLLGGAGGRLALVLHLSR